MNLLFTRSQISASFLSLVPLRIGGTVTFRLRAELELSDEERVLARKYGLSKATLVYSDPAQDLANAFRPALFLGLILGLLISIFVPVTAFGRGFEGLIIKAVSIPAIGLATMIVMTCVYFFKQRKHITVDQLTNGGRWFDCHSVVELDEMEKELLDLCQRFYLTLEKAKNWGGREINPLPDGEPFYLENPHGNEHRTAIDNAMHQAGQQVAKLAEPFRSSTTSHETPDEPQGLFQKLNNAIHEPSAKTDPPPAPQRPTTPPPQQPPPTTAPATQVPPDSSHPFAPKPPENKNSGF